jgi:hypothetical protein
MHLGGIHVTLVDILKVVYILVKVLLAMVKENIEMYNPLIAWFVEDYRRELLKMAEQRRLLKAATGTDQRPWERFFTRVGEVLVIAGCNLQRRFDRSGSLDAEGSLVCS